MTPNPEQSERLLAPELREPLEDWSFNVLLECSGREESDMLIAIGGAFLDLRDLNAILGWARARAGDGA